MRRTAALALGLFSGAAAAEQHARVAVVVGLDRPTGRVPALPMGQVQAANLATSLTDTAGYDRVFTLLGDAVTADELLAISVAGLDATAPDGSLLFVYVGHGAGGDYGEPALLTVGATVEDPSGSGLSLERLAAALVPRFETQSVVVALDAAHEGAVDGVALIGPSAEDWPDVPDWGLAITTPNARGRTAEAGRLVPALTEAFEGQADENYDGSVTISELARYVGREMSDGRGSLLNTAGSVDAGLRMSDAGMERPSEPMGPAVTGSGASTSRSGWALHPAPVVLGGIGLGAGIASAAMYFNKRADCVEYDNTLRCGEGSEYERYRAAQHALGWSAGVMLATAVGVQVVLGPSSVGVTGRW